MTISVAILANILIFITLPTGNVALFCFNIALNGLGIVPVSPISYAFAVELTFPTPEHVSNGLIILPSKIYSGALGIIAGYLSEYHDPKYAVLAFLFNAIISLIGCFFIKEELKRL
jgi:MFS family permease